MDFEEKPHIVIVPYPAQGHLLPMIHLSKTLAAKGLQVTFVNFGLIHDNLSQKWKNSHGEDINLVKVDFGIDIPSGLDAAALRDPHHFVKCFEEAELPFEELLKSIQPTPCCVIADYFLTWAIHLITKLNIPSVTYFPGTAAYSSLHHHVDLLFSRENVFQEDIPEGKEDKVIDYIPGVGSLQVKDFPGYFFGKRAGQFSKSLFDSSDRMKYSEWILVNSVEELEPETFSALREVLGNKNFVPVGPLFPLKDNAADSFGAKLRDEDTSCLQWLDTQEAKSVLYISFGSLAVLSEDGLEELAAGLEASMQKFLWVIRSDTASSNTKFLDGFCKRTKERGLVVAWAPQVRVLAHGSIGGFLSHCGWNSTFESICHGVPILGWPCIAEQSTNCKMVVEWKFGKRFARETECINRTEAAKMITNFMHGDEMAEIRSKVERFKEIANATTQEGGTSYENLQRFVQEMKKKNTKGVSSF